LSQEDITMPESSESSEPTWLPEYSAPAEEGKEPPPVYDAEKEKAPKPKKSRSATRGARQAAVNRERWLNLQSEG
jgi:hypothetical protein